MKNISYGKPYFLHAGGDVQSLVKYADFDETFIQDLIFGNPECLPVSDIDESYNPIIPVCKELNTNVGPLDILMVSPNGELTIIETKLWRNPEARRKVVAQILDYAKELSTWSYEDLQREVSRRVGKQGNTLYDIVKTGNEDYLLPEQDFIDSVSRNLDKGRFLLLIVGDGIKEGAKGLVEFLDNFGNLDFTFAMVELCVYKADDLGMLIVPRTLVKTVEISRSVVELPVGFQLKQIDSTESVVSSYWSDKKEYLVPFWNELVQELEFDDPGQPIPTPATSSNLYVYPSKTKKVWISAYFMNSQNRVGVYFRAASNSEGNSILESLDVYKDQMKEEFKGEVIWTWDDNYGIEVRRYFEDVYDPKNRDTIKAFFKEWLNTFVNVLRPRLKKIVA